ncbi:MAG TPA: ATP synthase F1 subunit delta [Rectinemataceae bacterium]|nr:ATP synthase F1 subunit delta [Rectinemataceae bacterium]
MPDRRRAWARALFGAAAEAGRRASYADALDGIAAVMAENRLMANFLSDPSVPKPEKKLFLASALLRPAGAPEDAVFSRFCALLVDKGRCPLIPAIAAEMRHLVDAEQGLVRLEIEAAREPDADTIRRIREAWTRSVKSAATVSTLRVRPELIAGYRLRSGSIRIDYSVAGRLERLRRQLVRPLGASPQESGRGEG